MISHLNLILPADYPLFRSHHYLLHRGKTARTSTLRQRAFLCQIIQTQNHVLRWIHNRAPICRVKQIAIRQHERPTLHLCRLRQRHMHRHLIPIKISIKRFTHKRMKTNRLPLHQHRLKSLNAQSMQCRRPIKHNWMLFYHFIQHRKYLRRLLFHEHLCLFDVRDNFFLNQLFHNKGLKQLKRHFCRQPALPQLKFRPHYDNRTPGIVDPLAQKILAKTPLLPLEHVRNRLKRPV